MCLPHTHDTQTHTHTHTYIHSHSHTHTHIHTYTYTHTHIHTHTYLVPQALISLCAEERNHAMDFLRKGGNIRIGIFLGQQINGNLKSEKMINQTNSENELSKKSKSVAKLDGDSLMSLAVRVIAAASSHESYVTSSISFTPHENESLNNNNNIKGLEKMKISEESSAKNVLHDVPLSLLTPEGKFKFDFLCSLLSSDDKNTQHAALSLMMRILKSLPLSTTPFVLPTEDNSTEEKCKVLLELLSPENENKNKNENENKNENDKKKQSVKMIPLIPFLSEHSARMLLKGLLSALNTKNVPGDMQQNIPKDKENIPELHTSALDAISAFVSQSADYYGKIIPESTDVRLESLEYRKARQQKARMLSSRSKSHAGWAVDEGAC